MTVQQCEISTGTNHWGKYLLWNNWPPWNLRIPAKDKWKQFPLSQEFNLSLITNTVFPVSGPANWAFFIFFLNWKMSVNKVMYDPTPVRHQSLTTTSRRWQSDTKKPGCPLILTPHRAKVTELEKLSFGICFGLRPFLMLPNPQELQEEHNHSRAHFCPSMRNPLSSKAEGSFQPKGQTA